jgi:hypothetical protein
VRIGGWAMTKRDLLDELMEGVAAMKGRRGGTLTLRSFKVEPAPLPKVDAKLIRGTRQKLDRAKDPLHASTDN